MFLKHLKVIGKQRTKEIQEFLEIQNKYNMVKNPNAFYSIGAHILPSDRPWI